MIRYLIDTSNVFNAVIIFNTTGVIDFFKI